MRVMSSLSIDRPFPQCRGEFSISSLGVWAPGTSDASEAHVVFRVSTGASHTQLYLTPAEAAQLAEMLRDAAEPVGHLGVDL